jgi:hypothetical protein
MGWPAATIAFYGPDASRASKVVAGIVASEHAEAGEMRDWKARPRPELRLLAFMIMFRKDIFLVRKFVDKLRTHATSKWGVTDMNDYRMICFFYLGLFQP